MKYLMAIVLLVIASCRMEPDDELPVCHDYYYWEGQGSASCWNICFVWVDWWDEEVDFVKCEGEDECWCCSDETRDCEFGDILER